MFIRTWTLLTFMLTALSLGVAIGHLLELPAKMRCEGPMWLKVQQTLYGPGFGTFGAGFEVGAVVATAVLAVLLRHKPPAFGWVVLAALCIVATRAAFWILLAPSQRHDRGTETRSSTVGLDGAAQSVGVHPRCASGAADHCLWRPGVFDPRCQHSGRCASGPTRRIAGRSMTTRSAAPDRPVNQVADS